MTRRPRGAFAAMLLAVGFAGATAAGEAGIFVSTAASLHEPTTRVVENLRGNPDWDGPSIHLNTGGSSALAQQILRGAPADLFLSASRREIRRLADAGRIRPAGTCALAGNRLVVVAPPGGDPLSALHQLSDPRFSRIGVANPRTAPLGRYTEQAFQLAGIDAKLKKRRVVAEHARQLADYAARGEVDAAIVYATDARRFADLEVVLEIDPALHDPVAYLAARLVSEEPSPGADRLFDYLCSVEGRAWFLESGFAPWPGRR